MLGFPAAMFWAIFGAYSYTLFVVPWVDMYFYVAFASLLGMVPFTAYAAFGLREKKDTIAEDEMDDRSGASEEAKREAEAPEKYFDEASNQSGSRVSGVRERARLRREHVGRKRGTSWGEFK
jgi:hypothetical protein